MFERIKSLVDRWQDLKEIDALSDRDIDDLGMTRDQVRQFVMMPADIAERVQHMAAVFGLSQDDLHRNHGAYVEMLERCGGCTDRAACSRALAMGDKASPAACAFCRNADAFSSAA